MWDEDRIDTALDETARHMTAGEPHGDFRARVVARIDGRPRVTAMCRPVLAGLSVAAAVFAAGIVVLREYPRPGTIVPPQARITPDATAKPGEVKPDVAEVRLPPLPLHGFGGPRRPDPTYDGVSGGNVQNVESLDLPSIDLGPIAVAALPPDDSIHIEPLPPVAPIAVTPLGVANEGDPR